MPTHARKLHINKKLDVIERTVWTFINATLGILTASAIIPHINLSFLHSIESAAIAAAFTMLKSKAAQEVGDSGMGDAIPGASVVKKD